MQENDSIPIPTALKELIVSNNLLLQHYQQELSQKVFTANMEMMQLLGLSPEDGWRLNMETMYYVKQTNTTDDTSVS